MRKIKSYVGKVYNHYRYHGLKVTLNAILYKLKMKMGIGKGKTYIDALDKYKNFNLNDAERNEDILYKKDNKNVYIFGTVPYFDVGGGQRSSQLAKVFNKFGFSIYYIYAYECSESNIPLISIPATYHKFINNAKYEEIEDTVKKDDIFIFEGPIKLFDKYLALAKIKGAKVIYENIDNWETSLGDMFFDRETLKMMLNNADMIVATAEKLVSQTEGYIREYCKEDKKVYYLANAVDDEIFEPRKVYEKPEDLKIGSKTLLYYGSLWGEWFDWDIIKDVANSNKDISINLIGDHSGIKTIVNSMPKNVHFLGIKRQVELPAYLKYSDFALLPFKVGKIGDYVSPLKIFEYISMNVPVLATTLPDIQNYPNVFASCNSKDWINTINTYVPKDNATKERDEFIYNNNWYNRCTKMLDVLFPEKEKRVDEKVYGQVSIVVLNYNNKKVIFNCVDTLLKFNNRYNYQIVVVDNMSSDGSYEMLKENYSDKITLVRNTKNGCSSGRNLGVENSKGKYILFLDSDEWILNKYWLDVYLELISNNEDIGAIGWGAGWFNNKGFSYKVVDAFEHFYMPPDSIARKDIGYLATCGFIMEKDLFYKVGEFDLHYDPTCYEDTDLSLKVRHSGKEIYYSKYLGVGHLPHQTTKSGTSAHDKLIREKGEYFIDKWKKIDENLIFKYVK